MMKQSRMAFTVNRMFYSSFILAVLSCSISNTRCDEEFHPVKLHLSPQEEYLVRTKLICRGWPCPNFTLIKESSDYLEERVYEEQDIVSTIIDGCQNITSALMDGYVQLYKYRKGLNLNKSEMALTVPVVIEVSKGEKDDDCNKYKIWIYANLNSNSSDSTTLPQPSEDGVNVERLRSLDVFVQAFSGNFTKLEKEMEKLKSDVHEDKRCFNPHQYMIAVYDPPWRESGRRNEIWLEKNDCSDDAFDN